MSRTADGQRQVSPVARRSRSVARARQSFRNPAIPPLGLWVKLSAIGGAICAGLLLPLLVWSAQPEWRNPEGAPVQSVALAISLGARGAIAGLVAGGCSHFLRARWMRIVAAVCLSALIFGSSMPSADLVVRLAVAGLGAMNGLIAALIVESRFGSGKPRPALSSGSGRESERAAAGPGLGAEPSSTRRKRRIRIAAPRERSDAAYASTPMATPRASHSRKLER